MSEQDNATRNMTKAEAKALDPASDHYTAYVGPPTQYDFMGASQFRLLCALGLREHHKLLDFGCGSLRVGRLLLPYLNAGNYYGIEPNEWLISEAVKNEIGEDLIRIKHPHFDHNTDFNCDVFGEKFDFIVAQSIFSHTGRDLTRLGLAGFAGALADDGMALVTFLHGERDFEGDGWIYDTSVLYKPDTVLAMANQAGLMATLLPWYHPRQNWYLLSKSAAKQPTQNMLAYLGGAVLFDPALQESTRHHPSDFRGPTIARSKGLLTRGIEWLQRL